MWDFYENNPSAKLPFKKIGLFYYPENINEYEITLAKHIADEKVEKLQLEKYLFFLEQYAYKLTDILSSAFNFSKETINAACFLSLTPFALCQNIIFENKIFFMDMFFFSLEYAFESQKDHVSEGDVDDLRFLIEWIAYEMLGIQMGDFGHLWFNRRYAFEKICSCYGIDKCEEKCTHFMQYSYRYNKPFKYSILANRCCVFHDFDGHDIVPFPLVDIYDQTILSMACHTYFSVFKKQLCELLL